MRCASGSPVQLGIDGIRNRPIASPIMPKARKLDQRSISPRPPANEREPEHEQQVADDRAGQRAADDLGQPFVDRDQGDDQLGRVAERGVEEAADARARVLRRVLGGLADQPRERDQRSGREDEERRVAEVGEVVEGDDDGPEGQAREEDSSDHSRPATLPTHVIRAVFFDWGNTLVAWEFDPELFVEGHVRGPRRLRAGAPSQPAFTDAYSRAAAAAARRRAGGRGRLHGRDRRAARLARRRRRRGAVSRFVVAEKRVWRPTHRLEPAVVELIDALRARRARRSAWSRTPSIRRR